MNGPKKGVVMTELAELPPRTLISEKALANIIGVCQRTVRSMVSRYELPPPVRFAGKATWQAGKVLDHFEARADRAAREAERAARTLRKLGALE